MGWRGPTINLNASALQNKVPVRPIPANAQLVLVSFGKHNFHTKWPEWTINHMGADRRGITAYFHLPDEGHLPNQGWLLYHIAHIVMVSLHPQIPQSSASLHVIPYNNDNDNASDRRHHHTGTTTHPRPCLWQQELNNIDSEFRIRNQLQTHHCIQENRDLDNVMNKLKPHGKSTAMNSREGECETRKKCLRDALNGRQCFTPLLPETPWVFERV